MVRIWALAALAAAIWLASAYGQSRPAALRLDAPARQFSAARADAVLARVLGEQSPHPAGSANAQGVRARILRELAAMGVRSTTRTGMSCYSEGRGNFLPCGTVTNIIAELPPGPGRAKGSGKAILLMAHSDSVAAGPGAADDGSGVAILLEAIRALKARGDAGRVHPVIALFTDGEEAGLLGAAFYLRDPAARARIGAVINVEARGNRGPSYLFQTSPGNARLIGLYADRVSHYATSSLYGEIYKYLPNDTDLTPMLGLGVPAYNFAFIGNIAGYHTPLDRRENIDPRSLQQQGDNALALADALSRTDPAQRKGPDAAYLDVLGRWLPRIDQSWALGLSLAAFVMIALAGIAARRQSDVPSHPLLAAAMPALLIAGCVAVGFGLHAGAAWISGHDDPSFAHPVYLRLALGLGVFAVALAAARWAQGIFCWLWFAALAVACALFAPGLTPYFLFPALVAAPLLLGTVRGGRAAALMASALAALVVWLGLNQGGEAIMGLKMHPLFTVSAGFALLPLLPLLRVEKGWKPSLGVSLGFAVVFEVLAGLAPAYTREAPQRLNLRYVESGGKAFWLADPVTRLPDTLRAAANFSASPQQLGAVGRGYVVPAGEAHLVAPRADAQRDGGEVTLNMDAPGDGFTLLVPRAAGLKAVRVNGTAMPASGERLAIGCATPDCGQAQVTLTVNSKAALSLTLLAQRHGLPPDGARLLAARPASAVPSQAGDRTVQAVRIAIAAR